MKYKNNHFSDYHLVKYSLWFNNLLDNLEKKNSLFMSYIKKWPTYMDINSEMQSYMIMDNYHNCLGGTFMYPSTANKTDMTVNILLDNNKLTEEDSCHLVKQFIDFLGSQYADKEKIIIDLYNDIDLSKYDNSNFRRLYNTLNHISFEYNNVKVYEELKALEGRKNYHIYSRNSKDYKSSFIFNQAGSMFDADILTLNNESIKIHHGDIYNQTIINNQNGKLEIMNPKDNKYKIMNFISRKDNNTSIAISLYVNKDNEIEKCYIDYRLHKNSKNLDKGKIKGIYSLRIDSEYNRFNMFYQTRSGLIYRYPHNQNTIPHKDLFYAMKTGDLRIDNLDMLIDIYYNVFNDYSSNDSNLFNPNKNFIYLMFEDYKSTLDLIHDINNNISDNHYNKDNLVPVLKDSICGYINDEIDYKQKSKINTKRS